MKFGIVAGPVYPGRAEMSARDAFSAELRMCRTAQEVGFDGISVAHHYVTGPEAQVFPPLPMAAYIAAECPGMYLATTIFLLPLHQPVEVAEQVAALDIMTGGKFIFGVAQGYRLKEFESLGLVRRDTAGRLSESCQALKQLWSNTNAVSYEGDHFSFNEVTPSVHPVRPGGPPIMVGADKIKTVARVPDFADHWLPSVRHSRDFVRSALKVYKERLAEKQREFVGIPFTRDICVAATREQALVRARSALQRQYDLQRAWGQPGEDYDLAFEDLIHDRLIVGTPEHAAEQLVREHDEFKADFIWFRLNWPGMEEEACLDVIRALGEETLPLVRKEVGSASMFDL